MKIKENTNFNLKKTLENVQEKNKILKDANAKLKVDKEKCGRKKVSDAHQIAKIHFHLWQFLIFPKLSIVSGLPIIIEHRLLFKP
jgi:hypothetical protein